MDTNGHETKGESQIYADGGWGVDRVDVVDSRLRPVVLNSRRLRRARSGGSGPDHGARAEFICVRLR